jgi:hypothetical protein
VSNRATQNSNKANRKPNATKRNVSQPQRSAKVEPFLCEESPVKLENDVQLQRTSPAEEAQPSSIATSNVEEPVSRSRTALPPNKPIDYRRILTYFLAKKDPSKISLIDDYLSKHKGKETKLMLVLAKKYDCSNGLNRVFVDRVTDEHYTDYLALSQLYLSIFYPQDVDQAEILCSTYKGKEDELFKKLSSNFHAINPLKMNRKSKGEESVGSQPNYKAVLTAFFKEHDEDRVADVDDVLSKCQGKEAILFSVFALKYNTENALNSVFVDRLKATECKDHLALTRLYLSVFHPQCTSDAKSMLAHYQGREGELFSKLAAKFRACDALKVCSDIGKSILESIDEAGDVCGSPKRVTP